MPLSRSLYLKPAPLAVVTHRPLKRCSIHNPLPENQTRTPMRALIALCLSLILATPALDAGSSQASRQAIDLHGVAYVQKLADTVNKELDARKANVAIIARCGRLRSELPEGVTFTHVAFAVFEPVQAPDGHIGYTYTVYNLYQGVDGNKSRSQLVQDYTFDLCAGAVEPEIGIIIPTDELQKRILAVIRSPAYADFHNPNYNLIANPFNELYDNCVTHTLKVVVAAIYQTSDQKRVYENIRSYFKAEEFKLSVIEKVGVNLLGGVSDDDQDGRSVKTATYNSMERFLKEYGLLKEALVVRVEATP
jgi:hypothetical protein